jgi:type IV secretion system protein VirD4
MRSERWSTPEERAKTLKEGAAGAVLDYVNGKKRSYDGEGHTMILGVSGSGKSRRCTIPMTMSIIDNKESGIIADAKGEIYANTKDMIPAEYDVHVIDFRNLYEEGTEGWNPLHAPYVLWKSGTPKNKHIAEQMIEGLAFAMYPEPKNADPFWAKEARNVFLAAVYAIFEYASEDEINLASVYYLISKGDERFGTSTYLKAFVDLADNENVAMQLQSYITTAVETRGGIRSSFLDGLSMSTRSESVRSFLSHDELHINDLRGDKPTLIYIIVPDETPIYDELTGVLASQLMSHFVRIAEQEYGGKLPIRVNVLLEELGNIGRAITNLPHLMSAGRSRNIRVAFVLQSISQLVDIYGMSNATTIMSNCDVRIAFRVNHWDTLTELSRLCGEREVKRDGYVTREPLITQSQLAAMETGQALVIVSGRIKFITRIPDFTEMNNSRKATKKPRKEKKIKIQTVSYFDIKQFVDSRKKRSSFGPFGEEPVSELPFMPMDSLKKPRTDIEEFFKELEKQAAEEVEKEKREQKGRKDRKEDKFDKYEDE